MARYVPTKGGQSAECDGNIENEASACDATESCGDFNNAVAGMFGSQPSIKTEHPAADSSVSAKSSTSRGPTVPSFVRTASGTVQICTDEDAFDNHFANDFRPHSEVGHQRTHVHVQPVDYSIPLHFRADHAAALPADDTASHRNSSQSNVHSAQSSSKCDWAVQDDMLSWAGMLFDPEDEELDSLWASASAPSCVGAPQLLKSDPADEEASTSLSASAAMPAMPVGVVRMQSGGNREHGWTERFRSDSLDDVYALCAELC